MVYICFPANCYISVNLGDQSPETSEWSAGEYHFLAAVSSLRRNESCAVDSAHCLVQSEKSC